MRARCSGAGGDAALEESPSDGVGARRDGRRLWDGAAVAAAAAYHAARAAGPLESAQCALLCTNTYDSYIVVLM